MITDKAYKTHFNSIEEMESYLGKEIGLSPWLKIDQDSINHFATLTKDEQWIHIDPKKSANYSPYKTTIAHGFMVLSFSSHFAYESMSIGGIGMGVNYGLDRVRFTSATPVGAEIRGRFTLLSYEANANGAKYKTKLVIEIKGQEKPACIAEWIGVAYKA